MVLTLKSEIGYKQSFVFKIDNDFGIDYKCHMWHDELENKDFSSILNYANNIIENNFHLLDKLNKHFSYWDKRNLFIELKDDETIKYIKKSIKKSCKNFVNSIDGEEHEVYINGWLNIMTSEKVNRLNGHLHSNHENSYLSGNLVLTETTNSATSFALPNWNNPTEYHLVDVKSKKGGLNIFPSWLYHWVNTIEEDLRIVLGFDLFLKSAVDYYWKHNSDTDWPIKRAVKL